MSVYKLNERERTVLAVLIDHYIRTAEPVGSRVISTRYNLGVSPATVRNTLSDLEERGLIEQPHTSAGRIPTDIGYRLYVDELLRTEKLSPSDREKIKKLLLTDHGAIEDVLVQTARVLAQVTSQLAVTVMPKFDSAILNKVDLVQLTETKVMVILAVRSGYVRTILLEVEARLSADDIRETADLLNEKLAGLPLGEIQRTIIERLQSTHRGEAQLLKLFIEQREQLLSEKDIDEFHAEGTTNIISQKEFKDPEKLREFISLLEERRSLVTMLTEKSQGTGISVSIGSETNIDGLKSCSAVIRTYQVGDAQGAIGVIGPTRMEYAKLMSVVDYTAKVLSEILSR